MPPSPFVYDVDTASFGERVLERSRERPVLVDFWAAWCGPCKALAPVLERVVDDYAGGLELAKVDTDANRELAMANGIRSLPTVRLFKDGAAVAEFTGAQPESAVRRFLERFVAAAGPGDDLAAAQALVAAGDPAAALSLVGAMLAERPDLHAARLLEARALLALGRFDDAASALAALPESERDGEAARALAARIEIAGEAAAAPTEEALRGRIDGDPRDLEARFALALRQAAQERYVDAFEGLLAILREDRRFREDGARRAILRLLTALGPADPRVAQFRSALASALN